MTNQIQRPEDSFEKALEQGQADDQAKQMAQRAQQQAAPPKPPASGGPDTLTQLVDPNAWIRDLYGAPAPEVSQSSEKKKPLNHTPLDRTSGEFRQKQFFKKYQQEYDQFLAQKKRKIEQQKKQAEDEEKRKKDEEKKQRSESNDGAGAGQGKQKQRLGQPRRKATTELHPETKMGGAK